MNTKSNAAAFAHIDAILAEHGPILAGLPGVVEVSGRLQIPERPLDEQAKR